jgi:hypothetical protein
MALPVNGNESRMDPIGLAAVPRFGGVYPPGKK